MCAYFINTFPSLFLMDFQDFFFHPAEYINALLLLFHYLSIKNSCLNMQTYVILQSYSLSSIY